MDKASKLPGRVDEVIYRGGVTLSAKSFSGGSGGISSVSGAHILGSGGATKKLPTIVCAAMKYGDIIIPSIRHWDEIAGTIVSKIGEAYGYLPTEQIIQGFLDSQGNFLTRKEAWVVAEAANQIRNRVPNDTNIGLNSENLY